MHAEDRRPAFVGGYRGPDARRRRSGRRLGIAEDAPERALAREAHDDRPAERKQDVEASHELEVLLHRLAEADPWVEADPLFADPGGDREGQALLQEGRDLTGYVVVAWVGLHRPRLPLHV